MNGWTPKRRAKQAEAIKAWQPWERSTGPRTDEGKAIVARNAWKGGVRTQVRAFANLMREIDGLIGKHPMHGATK